MLKILTAYDENFKDIVALNLPILKEYCKINKYSLIVKQIKNFTLPPSWFKIVCLLEELTEKNSSYIMWLDADTLILKKNYRLENILKSNKDLYICKDMNGINCGVMIVKNTDLMHKVLREVNSLSYKYCNHIWWEQAALMELIEINYLNISNYIEYVPQKLLNAYDPSIKTLDDGYVNEDTFILHLPSLNNETRATKIKKYIEEYYEN